MDVGATGTISRPAPPGARRRGAGYSHSNSRAASPAVMVPGDGSPLPGPNAQLAPAEMLVADDSDVRLARTPSPPVTARPSSQPGEIPLEAVERALEGLSREDLVMALKRAKEHMDQLDSRLESQTLTIESLQADSNELAQKLSLAEAEADSLQQAVQQREERVDELLSEQYKMEDEVYSKLGIVERLRKQLDDSERARAEAERRYEEQTRTTDTERQYYADAEALLQSQKANMSSSNERLIAQNHQLMQENERLQAQVARLRPQGAVPAPASDQDGAQRGEPGPEFEVDGEDSRAGEDGETIEAGTGSSAGRTKVREVAPLRSLRTLKDETAAQELEQLRNELATLQRSHASLNTSHHSLQQELRAIKAQNVELRDQNESYLDILQEKTLSGALITESAVLSRRYSAIADESEPSSEVTSEMDEDKDDVSDVPDEPKAGRRRAARQRASTLERAVSEQPTSLANELEGTSEDDAKEKDKEADASQQWRNHRQRERLENLSNDPAVLKKEVAELQDANQALTLYISKIIDRIIAREGYENVLASDADAKRTLRGQSSRLRGQRSRVQLLPRDGERRPAEGAAPSTTPSPEEAKQSKRASVGILGFGRAGGAAADTSSAAKPRRTASIDWRSWVPAAVGGSPAVDSRESQLRPLALSPASTSTATFVTSPRRREMEDANDEAERERIRAHLSMQGIDTENLPIGPRPPLARPAGSSGPGSSIGTFLSRVIPGAAVTGSPTTPKRDSVALPSASEPRLTTFDDIRKASGGSNAGLLGPGPGAGGGPSASRKASNGMLSIDESGNSSVITEGSSVAGDESYAYEDVALGGGSTGRGSVSSIGKGADASYDADEPGWRKALKRMSLLGGEVAPPSGSGA